MEKPNRQFSVINCQVCGKEMKVRNDYLKKHSGICTSCQKRNNQFAKTHGDYR